VPTFASYFPEAALEDFDRAQRAEAQYALRKLCRGVATIDPMPGISRWFQIDTLPDCVPEVVDDGEKTVPALQVVLAELMREDPDFEQLAV